ncbi:hypothetical protein H6G74_23665 [Nostoc spongiaeforme FACHB-130]|uniref:Uncharacterized protein n=1 Tax=Nostoc spongiaeforme FACHB-130 TaxID=1357510 RepID=A0ABR8G275_9NOSO|nr:hypothetical protein [Nostoc spongiaeforme]MBD2597295.1 hypothetical protein [Nostoc spongiaeforme FACHB-130]
MVSVRNGTFTPTNHLRTNRRCGSVARGDEKNGTTTNPQPTFATSLETGRTGLGMGGLHLVIIYHLTGRPPKSTSVLFIA